MGLSILNPENFQQLGTVDYTSDPELPGVAELEKFSDQRCKSEWGSGERTREWERHRTICAEVRLWMKGKPLTVGVSRPGFKRLPGVRCWEVLWGYLTKETWLKTFTEWIKAIEQCITSYPEMRERTKNSLWWPVTHLKWNFKNLN